MEKPKQKKVTSVNPLEGALNYFSSASPAMVIGLVESPGRKDALTDEFEDIIVDTCCPTDTKVWETGIRRMKVEGTFIIVTQYHSKKEAVVEHQKWVEYLKENPTCELKDIDMWNIGLNNALN